MTFTFSTQELIQPTITVQSTDSMEPPKQYQMGSNLDHLIFDQVYLSECLQLQSSISNFVASTMSRAYQYSQQCCCSPESLQLHPGGTKYQEKFLQEQSFESSSSRQSRHHRGPTEGFDFWSISRFSNSVSRWYNQVVCEIRA